MFGLCYPQSVGSFNFNDFLRVGSTVFLAWRKPGCRVACGFLLVKWAVDREEVARVVGKVAALFR